MEAEGVKMVKSFIEEISFSCAVDRSDPQFYVVGETTIPCAAFRIMNDCEGYWHGVLTDGWTIANFSDFRAREASLRYLIIRDRMRGPGDDILLPVAFIATISQHSRIAFGSQI